MAGAKGKKGAKAEAETEDGEKPEDAVEGEGGEGGEGQKPKKKLSGRTLILFIALPAVVLIAAGVGAAFMLGLFGGKKEAAEGEAGAHAEEVHTVFYDVPELLVNLKSETAESQSFLKLVVALELPDDKAVAKVEAALPRIVDGAQVFLREMRLEDFDGSAGMLRLREELLRRVNAAVAPLEVKDVLFKEIIVQ